jgi:hypothetical protein
MISTLTVALWKGVSNGSILPDQTRIFTQNTAESQGLILISPLLQKQKPSLTLK